MRYDLDTFRGDVFGAVVCTVVVLPGALGLGVVSGMGAAAGLYGAIAVGLFASVFGGTRSQISGPTPAMAVAVAVVLSSHAASIAEALAVVVLAGLLQVLLGVSRVGRFLAYTPYMVVSGFVSGTGIFVMSTQSLTLLGASGAGEGALDALRALPGALSDIDTGAFGIGAVTLAVAFLWPRQLSRFVPGTVAALAAGTALGVLWFREAPVLGAFPVGLPAPQFGPLSAEFLLHALQPAAVLALIGSVNSLLTSRVADSMTGDRHNPDRELVGQGIGNIAAGLFGGMPGAGGTTSTTLNIRSGGSTPVSGVLRALILLALVLGLGRLVEPVPLAALAGVTIRMGWSIVDWRLLTRLHRLRREHLFVMLTTLGLTVFVDLLTAVAIGLIAGGMVHAWRLERLELDSVISVPVLDSAFFAGDKALAHADPHAARVGMVVLRGTLSAASSHKLVSVIGRDIREHEVVIFDFSDAAYIDDSAAMVIEQLLQVAAESGTECIVMGLGDDVAATLRSLDILAELPGERIVGTLDEARRVAKEALEVDAATGIG